jgi:asparagine synthetase B (glutamine-hydrolysing)
MYESKMLKLIHDSVVLTPKPCVFLSGGLDSTILLHHLSEKFNKIGDKNIVTITAYWDSSTDELEYAKEISEYYHTEHYEVKIENILDNYKVIIPLISNPHRYGFYYMYLYDKAMMLNRENVYIGEGLDEHFGGYWYKPEKTYQEYWINVLEYSIPLHEELAKIYELNVHYPFIKLPVKKTIFEYDFKDRNKKWLRMLYKNILPDSVLNRKKQGGRTPWLEIWDREVKPHLGIDTPDTREEAQNIIKRWVYEQWLK